MYTLETSLDHKRNTHIHTQHRVHDDNGETLEFTCARKSNVKMFGAGTMQTKTCLSKHRKIFSFFFYQQKGETDHHLDKKENGYGSTVIEYNAK